MMGPDNNLDDIRQEIDAIDDGIVDLLVRRAAAQRKVKARKTADGSLSVSPIRPAREAEILRRIVARGRDGVSPDLLVRLWRVILSTSALSQAKICIHTTKSIVQSAEPARLIAVQFGPMPLAEHETVEEALKPLSSASGDLSVVSVASDWAAHAGLAGGAAVIGVLPVLKNGAPSLLVFGHAASQPTGNDCTLLVTKGGSQVASGAPLWTAQSGAHHVVCLRGYLGAAAIPAGAWLAGRFPDQIEG